MRRERIHAPQSNKAGCRDYLSNLGEQASAQVTYVLSTQPETVGNKDTMHVIGQSMNSGAGTGAGRRERKYPRVKVTLPAEARHIMESFPRRGQTANISEGGCYIEMVQTLEPPTCVDVVLWLNDEKIQARAEVVCRHAHLGNGIRFIRMSDADKKKLREFVEKAQKSGGGSFRKLGP